MAAMNAKSNEADLEIMRGIKQEFPGYTGENPELLLLFI